MKNIIIITLLFFISIFCKSFAIEVSSLEAEKRLEFSELFPKDICNKIKEEFDVKKIEYKYLNRETGLVDI